MATANDTAYNVDISDQHQPIIVNLRALIDASATVQIFGPSEETINNVLWCDVSLNVKGLYDGSSNALFEFWEPTGAARGTINARLATGRNHVATAQKFAESMSVVVKGGIDASAANPFQQYDNRAYDKYTSFGELALSYAAEGMFGHPSATAAITNDEAIVEGFNNDADKSTSPASAVGATEANQALAQRLAAALLQTGDEMATLIARQVLGQDASRATNEDNSERQGDEKAALRFYENDVVYVAIRLSGFRATVGAQSGAFSQQFNSQPSEILVPKMETYYLRMRLTATPVL